MEYLKKYWYVVLILVVFGVAVWWYMKRKTSEIENSKGAPVTPLTEDQKKRIALEVKTMAEAWEKNVVNGTTDEQFKADIIEDAKKNGLTTLQQNMVGALWIIENEWNKTKYSDEDKKAIIKMTGLSFPNDKLFLVSSY